MYTTRQTMAIHLTLDMSVCCLSYGIYMSHYLSSSHAPHTGEGVSVFSCTFSLFKVCCRLFCCNDDVKFCPKMMMKLMFENSIFSNDLLKKTTCYWLLLLEMVNISKISSNVLIISCMVDFWKPEFYKNNLPDLGSDLLICKCELSYEKHVLLFQPSCTWTWPCIAITGVRNRGVVHAGHLYM